MSTAPLYHKEVYDSHIGEYVSKAFFSKEKIEDNFKSSFYTVVKLSFDKLYDQLEQVFCRKILHTDSSGTYWSHIEFGPKEENGNHLLFSVFTNQNVTTELDNSEYFIHGSKSDVISAQEEFLKAFPPQAAPSLIWKYKVSDTIESANVGLSDRTELFDEFYPFLKMPVQDFIDDYYNSKQNILILLGPPGTGKTSLIRELIYKYNMAAVLTHDLELMKEDRLFADYLMSNQNALILEDADLLLTDRVEDDNKLMSKFLNLSDGLVKSNQKKMIFTANIEPSKVDSALTRPGRCYAAINFRPLTYAEAMKACNKVGRPLPSNNNEYNLTEIFNTGRVSERQKIGFR